MDLLSALPTELLHMICQSVQVYGVEHIASLRSCNHRLEDAASQYLFPVLVIGTRKRLLRRIRWVAARPQFARGVREIEYDITRYYCSYRYPSMRTNPEERAFWNPGLYYWENLCADQVVLRKTGKVLDTLRSALPYFPQVRTATITNGDVRRKTPMPSTCLDVVDITTGFDYQTDAYRCLVQAFAESPQKLREFYVLPQNLKDVEMLTGVLLLQDFKTVEATQAVFEHLTVVRLKSTVDCKPVVEGALDAVLGLGLIAQVLGYATRLRRLSLTFHSEASPRGRVSWASVIGKHTWSSLEQIEMDGIDILHATQLCGFLSRHRNSMTSITIRNINLIHGQWMTVADCLRDVPELQGLLLEGLEVESCEYLDCVTIMEISDRAMGGRHNNLIPDMDTLLGALDSY